MKSEGQYCGAALGRARVATLRLNTLHLLIVLHMASERRQMRRGKEASLDIPRLQQTPGDVGSCSCSH